MVTYFGITLSPTLIKLSTHQFHQPTLYNLTKFINRVHACAGDRELGMNSLPVAFGIDTAKYICVGTIDFTQVGGCGVAAGATAATTTTTTTTITTVPHQRIPTLTEPRPHPTPPHPPQIGVAYYLYSIGELQYALILTGLIVPQMFFQFAPGGLIEVRLGARG